MANLATYGFHDAMVASKASAVVFGHWDTQFTYTFQNFFHPFVGKLIEKLNRESLPGVLDATFHQELSTPFFTSEYGLIPSDLVRVEFFDKEIDVSEHGPYANYNWELFFHIPLTVAVHLSKTQRFAEAQRWFHYIFDPTSHDEKVPDKRARFWKFLAFRKADGSKRIDEIVRILSIPRKDLSPAEQLLQDDVLSGYDAIRNKPFQPHAVARTRHIAYQYSVVMKYLDNLIAWGDNLFQQDTVESINEATQRYVLAANILGPRPQRIPPRGRVQPKTFAQLKSTLGPIGDALVDLEGQFPFNFAPPSSGTSGSASASAGPLFGIGRTLYFCLPRNEKLLSYWDTVADRLFKIRHCMNIAGVVRPLALFDPPIDPAMLVKAAAAGIDIGSIVSGLNQPIGPVRSRILIQKALELCSEVRALGASLLSALEKGDGEHLALARQRHEIQLQQMVQEVRFLQWKAAEEATKSLLTTREAALERLHYYQRLLALPADQKVPTNLPLDRRELKEENFDEAHSALVGQYEQALMKQVLPALKLAGDSSPATQSGASGMGKLYLTLNEAADLNRHGPAGREFRTAAIVADTINAVLGLIPDVGLDIHFWGLGGNMKLLGGTLFAGVGQILAASLESKASNEDSQGASAAKTTTLERRADEWLLQHNLAAQELMQIGRQILTSLIAEQIAHHEYMNVQKQIENAQEMHQLIHDKFTNEELYLWMQGEISRLYYEYYRFAFDTARKAERTMKQELMRPELDSQDFVKFNYWDGGRKGLLSGEALHLDLKRMEMAYHDNNKRELELTRHVSLRQLNPAALLSLRLTGSCKVVIPEWLYDLDCPGHYMRRIKSVALSLPSPVSPNTSVNCTLSLLKSSVRKSPILKDGAYARQGAEDDRFVNYSGAVQSIVTSGASNDSGLFETDLNDERYLPFEGAGAESEWKLDLPADFPAFDYSTISDAILHIRYTARQGVVGIEVVKSLNELFGEASQSGLALLFSLRQDFPAEWTAFVNGAGNFAATIRREQFPYFAQGKKPTITGFELYGPDVPDATKPPRHHPLGNQAVWDAASTDLSDNGEFTITAAPDAPGPTQVLTRTANAQVFLIVKYSL